MKKNILLLAVLLSTATLRATDFNWQGFNAGAAASANGIFIVNQLNYGNKEMAYKLTIYPAWQLAFGYNFTPHLGVQLNCTFAKQGQDYDETIDGINFNRQVVIHYTHLPIFFKYMTGMGAAQLYAMVGPDLAFRGNYSSIFNEGNESTDQKAEMEPKDGELFTKTDFGINFSIGSNIRIAGNVYINAGIEIYDGFTDINSPAYRYNYKSYTYGKSSNFYAGVNVGVHYLFTSAK